MNEYVMVGLVGVVALALGFGGKWLAGAISGKKTDKPS